MAHGYRSLQQWDRWLTDRPLGKIILESERKILSQLVGHFLGKQVLLIGVPAQRALLNASRLPCQTLCTPLAGVAGDKRLIEGELRDVPILSASIDLVVLPHTLEFVANPRQLLAEACRVIKPEGLIALAGFNPYSFWGIKKILADKLHHTDMPWFKNFLPAHEVKNWLKLADFVLEKHATGCYQLPVNRAREFSFLDKIGEYCFPKLGGIYLLIARAKLLPLTPIKLKWKQNLGGITIPTAMSGHIMQHLP